MKTWWLHRFNPRILFLPAILLLVLANCTSRSESETDTTRRITYGLTLSVSGIDPHIHQNSELGIILRQVYDTLIYRHPETKEFAPGLAQSWSRSDDGLEYTFILRNDVVFHDGTAFNAQAVAANFARILDPETSSQRARLLLGPIASYQVIDDFTFRVTLTEPYSPLLDGLSQIYLAMASPTALEQYSALRYQYHQVGTGPFIFVEYIPEDRIVIRRNPAYQWAPSFYPSISETDNLVDEIVFRFFRDPATRLIALENGTAQIMGELLPTDARALANNSAIQVAPAAIPGQPLQFYMNLKRSPTDILALRQALLYGTNRVSIVEAIYQGFSPVAWGPISTQTLYYNRGVTTAYAYDATLARSLITSLGYVDSDGDGYLELAGEPLELRLIQPPWGLIPQVAQLLQDQWRALGIRLIIDPVPGFAGLLEKVAEEEWNLVAFDTSGLDPALLNPRFLSTGSVNWTGYANPEVDRLLLEAIRASDDEQRRLAYGQVQAFLMQDAVILPIRDYVNLNAYSTRLDGLRFDAYGWFPILYGLRFTP